MENEKTDLKHSLNYEEERFSNNKEENKREFCRLLGLQYSATSADIVEKVESLILDSSKTPVESIQHEVALKKVSINKQDFNGIVFDGNSLHKIISNDKGKFGIIISRFKLPKDMRYNSMSSEFYDRFKKQEVDPKKDFVVLFETKESLKIVSEWLNSIIKTTSRPQ